MQADEVRYKEDMPALGLNWIRLGLDDVLYDPKTKTIYTPNTNASVKVGEGGIAVNDDEQRMWLKGEHGYFAGSTPGGAGSGVMHAPVDSGGGATPTSSSQKSDEKDKKSVDKSEKDAIIEHKDEIIADFKSTNFNGEIHIPPREIDVNSLSFDKMHIFDEGHDVNLKSARQYIKNAKISVTRTVEGDEFENYYGDKGATYVNITKNLIRTSFPKKEFNEGTDRILDTVNKHLKKKE